MGSLPRRLALTCYNYIMRKNYGNLSFTIISLTLPLTLLFGKVHEWWLKSRNPDNVDITAGLAYLRPLLVSSLVVFFVLVALAVITGVLGLKRDEDKSTAHRALASLAVAVVVCGFVAFSSNRVSKAEDNYRDQKASAFFKALEDRKN